MIKQTTSKTIKQIFSVFNECYPRKFEITDRTEKIWFRMLRDLDSESVLAAAYHLCSSRPDWPPDVAIVRITAINIASGELSAPTGQEAWENIRKKFEFEDYPLTDMEKAALAQVGSIYDLKLSSNTQVDRANFVKAFNNLVKKQQLERSVLPEVKALVEQNIPFLPESDTDSSKQNLLGPAENPNDYDLGPDTDSEEELVPIEEIRAFAAEYAKAIDLKERSDREKRRAKLKGEQ